MENTVLSRFFLVLLLFFVQTGCALKIELTSDLDDMILSKKMWLRFDMDQHEQGILKNSLQFSVNQTDVSLLSWHSQVQPVNVFSEAFKKRKKMFTDSFTGWIAIDFEQGNFEQRKMMIRDSSLYVSCFLIRKDGKIRPFASVLQLERRTNQQQSRLFKNGVVAKKTIVEPVRKQPPDSHDVQVKMVPMQAPDFERSFQSLEKLSEVWASLCTWFVSSEAWNVLCCIHFVVVALLAIIIFKRRYRWLHCLVPSNGIVVYELTRMLGFCVLCFWLCMTRFFVSEIYFLYAASVICFFWMIYAFITPSHEDFFIGRLKSLIGVVFGALMLPLALKAYLLQCGF